MSNYRRVVVELPLDEFEDLMEDVGYFFSEKYGWVPKDEDVIKILCRHGIIIQGY